MSPGTSGSFDVPITPATQRQEEIAVANAAHDSACSITCSVPLTALDRRSCVLCPTSGVLDNDGFVPQPNGRAVPTQALPEVLGHISWRKTAGRGRIYGE